MKKKIIQVVALSAFACAFVCGSSVKINAATVTTVDGITWVYTLNNGNATNVYAKSGEKGNLVIPEKLNGYTVTSIGGGTASTPVSTSSTTIEIPDTVKSINDYGFYCSQIESVSLNKEINSVGANAFEGCSNLKTLYVGDNVDTIGASAFKNCTSLVNLNMYEFNGELGASAFENCTSLTTLWVGELDEFGEYAFKNCSSLENLEVNSNLTTQFQNCYSLRNIVIGKDVESIDAHSFQVKNAGGATAQLEGKYNVKVEDYYLSNSILNRKSIDTQLQAGEERNWFFLNPNTQIGENKIDIIGGDYCTLEPSCSPVTGWVDKITYTTASVFLPSASMNMFQVQLNGSSYYSQYLSFKFTYDTGVYYSKSEDVFVGEYNNTVSGYAINNIYVEHTGTEDLTCPENVQNAASGIYEKMASEQIQIFNLSTSAEEVPCYAPVPVKEQIQASYSGTVTEGMSLDLNNIVVTSLYSDNSMVEETYNSELMNVSYDNIVVGQNVITLEYDGFTCSFEVEGVEKIAESLTAEINIENAREYYDTERGFLTGDVLDKNMFKVQAFYNNQTNEFVDAFDINTSFVNNGLNTIVISYNGISTTLDINGYKMRTDISVRYDGTVTEGMEIDLSKIIISSTFHDGTVEETIYSEEQMKVDCKDIVAGDNSATLTFDDFTYTFNIPGVKKVVESDSTIDTTIKDSSNTGSVNNSGNSTSSSGTTNSSNGNSTSSSGTTNSSNGNSTSSSGTTNSSNGNNSTTSSSETTSSSNENSTSSSETTSSSDKESTSESEKKDSLNKNSTSNSKKTDSTSKKSTSGTKKNNSKKKSNTVKKTKKDNTSKKKVEGKAISTKTTTMKLNTASSSISNSAKPTTVTTKYVYQNAEEELVDEDVSERTAEGEEEENEDESLDAEVAQELDDELEEEDAVSIETIYERVTNEDKNNDISTGIPIEKDDETSNEKGSPIAFIIIIIVVVLLIIMLIKRRRDKVNDDEMDGQDIVEYDESEFVTEDIVED